MENRTTIDKNQENNFQNNLRDIRLAKILENNNASFNNYQYQTNLNLKNNNDEILTPLLQKENSSPTNESTPMYSNKGLIILGFCSILLYTLIIFMIFKYQ